MYDIRVIRGNKNALVNYINALHIFRKNLGGHLDPPLASFFYLLISDNHPLAIYKKVCGYSFFYLLKTEGEKKFITN